jgi:hypothetical protein
MGNFYTNLTIRSEAQREIANVLERFNRHAYICPPANGNVVVVDEACDSQDFAEIELLGTKLSAELGRPVFAVVNHDDDVIYYWLSENGSLIDQYDSTPDYFNFVPADVDIIAAAENYKPAAPKGGNARQLCEAFNQATAFPDVDRILRKISSDYVFAMERHQELLKALGMSGHSLGTAYASFEYQELPDDLVATECIRVG